MQREDTNYMLLVDSVRFWVLKYLGPWTVVKRITMHFLKILVPSNHVIILNPKYNKIIIDTHF